MILACETITPLFLAGADGTTPELRAPSIKGALRFWWRAMNGDLVRKENGNWNCTQLKEKEGKIFGDTSNKSAIILKILNEPVENGIEISLTPHHRNGYCAPNKPNCKFKNGKYGKCSKSFLKEGKFFNFELMVCFDNKIIEQKDIKKLVKVTFLLGGLGKRSRRGFGSVKTIKIDNNVVFSSLSEIKSFVGTIIPQNQGLYPDYPLIKDIQIGKSYNDYKDLLIKIGESSHLHKDDSLGYARPGKRLASPVYTSVIKIDDRYYPIVTTLNNDRFKNTSQQNDYKRAILL